MSRRLIPPRSPRILIPILLLAATASALAQGPNAGGGRRPFARAGTTPRVERVRTFDVRHVRAELTLDTKQSEIRGTVTHTLVPLAPGLDAVTLDCGADLKVSKVVTGSGTCAYSQKGDELIITLDRTYGPADTVALAVTYAGKPDVGIRFVKPDADHPNRQVAVWTQGEPEDARFWIPCYDQPNERSTAELIVTVDKPLSVVSNGLLQSTRENADGTTTFDWKMDQQLPAYLLSVTAADFAVYRDKFGSLPVDYYVLKEVDEATARRTMGKTPQMIEFFNGAIGTPYGFEKYATVCLPEFGGGMEHSSATTMTDTILSDPIAHAEADADSIVAHELAHQWFGDLLTCRDWANLWLNEGFASYFDPLFTEHEEGADAFGIVMAGNLQSYLGQDRQYRRPIVEARYNDPWQMFDGVTYAKGSLVLHALRGVVGDDAWWRGIKLYVARNKDKNVVTADFRAAMEEAAGKDLGWFFDQWVYHGGHPELAARWRYEADDKTIRLKIEQTQTVDETTPLFRLPTTVEIGDDAGVRSVAIVIDAKTQEFVIPAATRPKLVRIDPQGSIPKVLTFDKPTDEWVYQLDHAGNFVGRFEAAKALAGRPTEPAATAALSAAWARENDPRARTELVELLTAGEPCRAALLLAAKDADARVKDAAVAGLAALKLDAPLEALDRAIWASKTEPYRARRAAFDALVQGKVKDADELIEAALHDPTNNHSFARSALGIVLNQGGQKAREAAVLFSRPGQPAALRAAAIPTLAKEAKEDPQAEKYLVALLDDPSSRIRNAAGSALASGGFTAALPKLEQLVAKLTGRARQQLEPQVEQLKRKKEPATTTTSAAADASTKEAADLDRQAADLELQAKDLRNRAEAARIKAERAKQTPAPKPAA